MIKTTFASFALLSALLFSCQPKHSSHEEMLEILEKTKIQISNPRNAFAPEAKLKYIDSVFLAEKQPTLNKLKVVEKASYLLELGREDEVIQLLEPIVKGSVSYESEKASKLLALAYLRAGERANCISNHAAESCIMPLKSLGIHRDTTGSSKAIRIYETLLKKYPLDLESRWLLNIAYMTLGKYPDKVPSSFLIPGMEGGHYQINPFLDIAASLQLNINNMGGGTITDDFDNDGYLDIVTSGWGLSEPMHYFHNNANGTFTNLSAESKLSSITGGLNLLQADYNNDGYKDILVLRGAWKGEFGTEPNSLLKNNGDNTFTDVTTESGLLSFHPTQTATWNDFNNDGWLDLFIGNETFGNKEPATHPCELYINKRDGTFQEIAKEAKCNFQYFVKGVTSGDYNNDGWVDISISTMNGNKILLKNSGNKDHVSFVDVSSEAGLDREKGSTFATWFWDYDNDGWLDIFFCDYSFNKTLGYYAAAEKLNIPAGNPEKMLLYHNNHDGTFTNVAPKVGLTTNVFAMGSNFGDIDNDGFLDMYFGTGNPRYESLIPNKMFKNLGGEKFVEVTAAARVGHLQKGHGVSFADMDNDGDQDIYTDMGGAYPGDAYQNAFFLNPGQGNNNWICLQLEGKTANRSAIGSRIKITCTENGVKRRIYRDVNSGGSFGASPLRREIGIGNATSIDEIEIYWRGSGAVETFNDVKANQFLQVKEGSGKLEPQNLKTINWILPEILCGPVVLQAVPNGVSNPRR